MKLFALLLATLLISCTAPSSKVKSQSLYPSIEEIVAVTRKAINDADPAGIAKIEDEYDPEVAPISAFVRSFIHKPAVLEAHLPVYINKVWTLYFGEPTALSTKISKDIIQGIKPKVPVDPKLDPSQDPEFKKAADSFDQQLLRFYGL